MKWIGKDSTSATSLADITSVVAGDALTGGGTAGDITIDHEDTSSQASVNNSGRAFIQDITLDTYGHVTGITSATDADTHSGTVTSFTVQTDSGSGARYSVTDAPSISILGATGVGVTNSSGVITAVSVPGEIDHDSLLNFAAQEHFTQANITTVGTIGTGVWEGTVVASAYLDADTAHLSTQKQLTWHGFTDDMDTTKQYVGLLDADSENTATTNGDLPFCAPVAGKLLKVFLSANKNLTGNTLTWRLETQALGVTFGTGPTIVGTQSGAGPHNDSRTMTTYDFTTSLDSGDNLIDAGDIVYLSVQSSGATATTKYYITCLWEWDLS